MGNQLKAGQAFPALRARTCRGRTTKKKTRPKAEFSYLSTR